MSSNSITQSKESDKSKNDYRISVIDGSEDDTCLVVNRTFHNAIRKDIQMKLLKPEHAGVSAARNFRLEHSRGECVMFFDSDDFMNSLQQTGK